MNWYRNAALVAVMLAAALPAFAQQQRMPRQDRGVGVEAALRMREELKLSGAQVAQLESLRKEIVAQRQNAAREMIDLRSRVDAGNIDPAEARKQMATRRDAMRETMRQRGERLEKILTAEQREQMGRMQRMQPRRGALPRGRAPGFGPPPRDRWRW
ncbi:MAG TPA: Spy/CpxP family protein refolding chaperone [Longimicrobiales bacterium]|nr:Spy/CpxP family protein refolding chaperone [Longimicrobiales bacterium]